MQHHTRSEQKRNASDTCEEAAGTKGCYTTTAKQAILSALKMEVRANKKLQESNSRKQCTGRSIPRMGNIDQVTLYRVIYFACRDVPHGDLMRGRPRTTYVFSCSVTLSRSWGTKKLAIFQFCCQLNTLRWFGSLEEDKKNPQMIGVTAGQVSVALDHWWI